MKRIDVVTIKLVKERSMKVTNKNMDGPKTVYNIVSQYLEGADREYLVVLSLNTKNVINSISTVSIGSLNSSIVHPREVFKTLIETNAGFFIIAHNHPSGNPTPSQEDINITKRLQECGKIMGIELLDHIIIGDNDYISLKEEGYV